MAIPLPVTCSTTGEDAGCQGGRRGGGGGGTQRGGVSAKRSRFRVKGLGRRRPLGRAAGGEENAGGRRREVVEEEGGRWWRRWRRRSSSTYTSVTQHGLVEMDGWRRRRKEFFAKESEEGDGVGVTSRWREAGGRRQEAVCLGSLLETP
jgi:hypothetical protein